MTTPLLQATRRCAVLLPLILAACASTTPHWDAQFGDTVRSLRAQQLVHPQAAANADPVNGIDGRAARAALERYEQAQPPTGSATPMIGK
jgi:hypothetical protein